MLSISSPPARHCAPPPRTGVPWTPDDFVRWLADHAVSPAAVAAARSLARRHGIAAAAEDLHLDWYTRLLATMRRKAAAGEHLAIADEDAAAAYAYVALRACAVDLRRHLRTAPMPIDPGREHPGPVVDPLIAVALDAVRADLRNRARSDGDRPIRTAHDPKRIAQIALAVLDVATRPGGLRGAEEPTGGTCEWDRLLYLALDRLDGVTGGDLRDARRRQVKARCSGPVRELLAEVLCAHGLGPVDLGCQR